MARAQAFLKLLNDEVFLKIPTDSVPGIAVQYGSKGDTGSASTGVLTVEVSLNTDGFDGSDPITKNTHQNPGTEFAPTPVYPGGGDWVAVDVVPLGGATPQATITAAGIYQLADAQGVYAVRARVSTAGNVFVTLVAQEFGAGRGE
jgi:hypothetical protein